MVDLKIPDKKHIIFIIIIINRSLVLDENVENNRDSKAIRSASCNSILVH